MWSKVSIYKCIKVSCYKPEEHPFTISLQEICPSATMGPRDADPKPLCPSGMRRTQGSVGPGKFGSSRANWTLTNSALRYLVFCFYIFFIWSLFLIIKSVRNFVLFSLDFRKSIQYKYGQLYSMQWNVLWAIQTIQKTKELISFNQLSGVLNVYTKYPELS